MPFPGALAKHKDSGTNMAMRLTMSQKEQGRKVARKTWCTRAMKNSKYNDVTDRYIAKDSCLISHSENENKQSE